LLQVFEYILDNLRTTCASAVIKCNYYLTRIVDDDLLTSIRWSKTIGLRFYSRLSQRWTRLENWPDSVQLTFKMCICQKIRQINSGS